MHSFSENEVEPSLNLTNSLFQTLNVYHDVPSRSAAMNMAIDEALLELAEHPCIRFYRWDHPALSFGYFGRFNDVANAEKDRELVRRWTGGGIVLHDSDLTYSVVIPSTRMTKIAPLDLYTQIHRAMCDVLVECGVGATLVEGTPAKISDVCFANPVRADLVVDGKKIAGAAQRRTRRGLLQQGSIRLENLPVDFANRFASTLCPACNMQSLTAEMIQRAHEIAEQKYGQRSWLERC
jgi:lipoate-protein ligase A